MDEAYKVIAASTLVRYDSVISKSLAYILWILYGFGLILWATINALYRRRKIREDLLVQVTRLDPSVAKDGILPSQGQAIMLSVILVMNIVAALLYHILAGAHATDHNITREIAAGTGVLAFANAPLLIGLAGRNNVLALLLNVNRTRLNVIHRWLGRFVVLLSLIHSLCCIGIHYSSSPTVQYWDQGYIIAGTVAMIAAFLLITQSLRFVRMRHYEVFIWSHIILALAFLIGNLLHEKYAQNRVNTTIWILIAIVLFSLDYLTRIFTLILMNTSPHIAQLTPLDQVTQVDITTNLDIAAGSTIYLTFPSISPFQSHPFSVLSVDQSDAKGWFDELSILDTISLASTIPERRLRFLIKAKNGMTKDLYHHASSHSTTSVLLNKSLDTMPFLPDTELIVIGTQISAIAGLRTTQSITWITNPSLLPAVSTLLNDRDTIFLQGAPIHYEGRLRCITLRPEGLVPLRI